MIGRAQSPEEDVSFGLPHATHVWTNIGDLRDTSEVSPRYFEVKLSSVLLCT